MPATRLPLVPAAYLLLLRGPADNPEVLLQLRQNTGYRDGHWAAGAAGHIDAGESAYACAAREAHEELGVTIERRDLSPLTALQRTDGTDDPIEQRIDLFFTARRWSGKPTVTEPRKCAALEWYALDALPEPLPPAERRVLGFLASGAVPPVLCEGFAD